VRGRFGDPLSFAFVILAIEIFAVDPSRRAAPRFCWAARML